MKRLRFPLVVFPLVAIALGSGAKADAIRHEVTQAEDLWFSVSEPMVFTVRAYAWDSSRIDSMLWLYDADGQLVVQNDDSMYGLDSWIEVPLSAGSYRLRAGVCCFDPDRWYGSSYIVETNVQPLPEEPNAIPSSTTTSTTVVESTTTTEVPVVSTTTTTSEAPTTTTEPVATTVPEVEVPDSTAPLTTVPETSTSVVVPTTFVEPPVTDAIVPAVTEVPTSTSTVAVSPTVVPEVVPVVPETVPEVLPEVTVVVPVTDPAPSDGTEPPFIVGLGDDQEDTPSPVSNGLRDGVTPEQQRIVVATSILSVMPVFRPTNATGSRSQGSPKKRKEA